MSRDRIPARPLSRWGGARIRESVKRRFRPLIRPAATFSSTGEKGVGYNLENALAFESQRQSKNHTLSESSLRETTSDSLPRAGLGESSYQRERIFLDLILHPAPCGSYDAAVSYTR